MITKGIDYLGERLWGADRYRRKYYKLAKRIAAMKGFEVYKPHMVWLSDPEFVAAREEAERRSIEGGPNDRCYTLLAAARSVREIPGDFAECGVRYGKSSRFLLSGAGAQSRKRLFMFDSFEGLSDPGADDVLSGGKTAWEKGDLAVSEDVVRRNLSDFADRIITHKGWIPDRFGEVEAERFSLVHVDVDLFEPTMATVEFFYPRVNPGDEFFADKPENVIGLSSGQSLVIKR
jgi:hypothetical protein